MIAVGRVVQRPGFVDDPDGRFLRLDPDGLDLLQAVLDERVQGERGLDRGLSVKLGRESDLEQDVIQGNQIGTNDTGSTAVPNAGAGVFVASGARANVLGGTATGARNVIVGNGRSGVFLSGASGNLVQGNSIGTDASGRVALPNAVDGVFLADAASANVIGGTATGAGNVISGNARVGVFLLGSGTSGNLVQGNGIGTDATGLVPLGNGLSLPTTTPRALSSAPVPPTIPPSRTPSLGISSTRTAAEASASTSGTAGRRQTVPDPLPRTTSRTSRP